MALEFYKGYTEINEECCILLKGKNYITKNDFLEIARTMQWTILKDELTVLVLEEGDL